MGGSQSVGDSGVCRECGTTWRANGGARHRECGGWSLRGMRARSQFDATCWRPSTVESGRRVPHCGRGHPTGSGSEGKRQSRASVGSWRSGSRSAKTCSRIRGFARCGFRNNASFHMAWETIRWAATGHRSRYVRWRRANPATCETKHHDQASESKPGPVRQKAIWEDRQRRARQQAIRAM